MKMLFLFTLLLMTNLLTIEANAASLERIPLWANTFYGMSLKEISLSYPNTQTKLEIPSNVFLKPNEQALAKLDRVEIGHQSFDACFVFIDNKLNRVILTLLPKVKESDALVTSDDLNSLYTQYAILLSAKYGNPVRKYWQDYAPLNIRLWNMQWISGHTNVELNVDKSQLDILYGAEYADDLGNL